MNNDISGGAQIAQINQTSTIDLYRQHQQRNEEIKQYEADQRLLAEIDEYLPEEPKAAPTDAEMDQVDLEIPPLPGMEEDPTYLAAKQRDDDRTVAQQQHEEFLNRNPAGLEAQVDSLAANALAAGGSLWDGAMAAGRQLGALGSFGLAPIANPSQTGDMVQDMKNDFVTGYEALVKDLKLEGEAESYGHIIATERLGLSGNTAAIVGAALDIGGDPAVSLSLPFYKAIQRGLALSESSAKATGTAGDFGHILKNGVYELFTFGKEIDPEKAAHVSKLLDEVENEGATKENIRALHDALNEIEGLDDAVRLMEEEEIVKKFESWKNILGDEADDTFHVALENVTPEQQLATLKTNDALPAKINTARIHSVEDADNVIGEVVEFHASTYDDLVKKAPEDKGFIDAEQRKLLSDYLGSERIGLWGKEGAPEFSHLTGRTAYAMRQTLVASAADIRDIAKAANGSDGSDIDRLAFARAVEVHKRMIETFRKNETTQGKIVEFFDTSRFRSDKRNLYDIEEVKGLEGATLAKETERSARAVKEKEEFDKLLTEFVSMEKDPLVVSKIIDKSRLERSVDGLFEIYVNAVLSGPITHAVNIASNTGMLFWAPTHAAATGVMAGTSASVKYIAEGSAFLTGRHAMKNALAKSRQQDLQVMGDQFSEATARIGGLLHGLDDARRLMFEKGTDWDDLKVDGGHFASGEIARLRLKPSLTKENFEMFGPFGYVFDLFGSVIRLPGYLLQKEDQLFKLMHYRSNMNAQAIKLARRGGGDVAQQKNLYEQLRANPTKEMTSKGIKEGEYFTFTNELGTPGTKLHEFLKKSQIGRFFVPFFATPTNIVKMGLKKGPLGEIFMGGNNAWQTKKLRAFGNIRDAIGGKGAEAHEARARLMMATAIPMMIINELDEDTITGSIDESTERGRMLAKVRPPYSIRIGDEWISYEGIEPLRSILGMYVNWRKVATESDMFGTLGEAQVDPETGMTDQAAELLSIAIMPVLSTITENYMLQQTSQVVNLVKSLARQPDKNDEGALEYFAGINKNFQKMAVSAVPFSGAMRQTTAQLVDGEFRMANTMLEKFQQISPWHSKGLHGRPSFFGEKQEYLDGFGPDLMSPLRQSPYVDDPYMDALEEMEVSVPSIPKSITVGGDGMPTVKIELTTEQQYKFQMIRAFEVHGDRSLKEVTYNLLDQPGFIPQNGMPGLSKEEQKLAVQKLWRQTTNAAKQMLLAEDPELQERAQRVLENRVEQIKRERQGGR